MNDPITSFTGEYRFLSNFWPAEVTFEGEVYPTVEHAYQAAKTLDKAERAFIQTCKTPGAAKRMGRTITIRDDWGKAKLQVMVELVTEKFQRHKDLLQKLKDTGDRQLIEGNTWGDTYWGVCEGEGENFLGKILMAARTGLHICPEC